MSKGIFIGLGGTGVTTVAKLKALLFQRTYNSNKTAMDADCTFIFYDTDPRAKDKAVKSQELRAIMGNYPVIDIGREFIDASKTPPYNLYSEAKNASASEVDPQRFLEWAINPDAEKHFKLPNKELSEGAGAQRMAGRTGVYFKYDEFENKIARGLTNLKQIESAGGDLKSEHPVVWVFASSVGGTSSSALMDVLYLVDRMYRKEISTVDPYLRLVLYMPKPFIDINRDNSSYYANGYATMWELNEFRIDALNRNDGNKFGLFAVRPDDNGWGKAPWNVCSYVLAVDCESDSGHITLEQAYTNTAELCYFLHSGSVGDSMVSNLDNDLSSNAVYAKNPRKVNDDPFDWAKFVVASGYKAITKADNALRNYVKIRLNYDLFGYGLMGVSKEKLFSSDDDYRKVVKEFSTEFILNHLVDIDVIDNSPKNSLYGKYLNGFDSILIPSESEIPQKDDWQTLGINFTNSCKGKAKDLQRIFDDVSKDFSKKWWIDQIKNSVIKGVDKYIINYGLNFTYSLIDAVDDQYCETIVLDKLKNLLKNVNLASIEKEINDIIINNKPKKGIQLLIPKLNEYKEASIRVLAIEHIKSIIEDITASKVGFLEYLRRGDRDHIGINGLMTKVNSRFGTIKKDYQDLASDFKNTSSEVSSDYFPKISEFVINTENWVRNNEFEQLYSSIVTLDYSESAKCFDCEGYGCPPVRDKLASILTTIKSNVPNRAYLFGDLAMCNPQTQFNELFMSFSRAIDSFINNVLNDNNNNVKQWLDNSLDTVFSNQFTKDGIVDSTAQNEYVVKFNASIPVFYPRSSGAQAGITTRMVYVGANEDFASKLGFDKNDKTMQFVEDNAIGNCFMVCKLEVGHNFHDYRHFEMLKSKYEAERMEIESEGSGCHIHKAFVKRDIRKAAANVLSKRFEDFLRLCWLDSYFEFLNSHDATKMIVEAIFGTPRNTGDWDVEKNTQKNSTNDTDEWGIDDSENSSGDLEINEFQDDDINIDDLDNNEDENYEVEEDVELGYHPIVEIENNGQIEVKIYKLEKSAAGLIGFASNTEPYEKNFKAATFALIRQGIINDFDVKYKEEFFKLFTEKFTSPEIGLTPDMRQKLVRVHSKYQEEIFKVFKNKLKVFLKAPRSNRVDELAFKKFASTIDSFKGKDIFK